jgi:Zn-dependent protease with chaperone function
LLNEDELKYLVGHEIGHLIDGDAVITGYSASCIQTGTHWKIAQTFSSKDTICMSKWQN